MIVLRHPARAGKGARPFAGTVEPPDDPALDWLIGTVETMAPSFTAPPGAAGYFIAGRVIVPGAARRGDGA